ncbi:MAG: hypothetical protein ACLTCB_08035 [Merdibacter sp.]
MDVRIVNGDEATVYRSHDIHAEDFGPYTNQSEENGLASEDPRV